MSYGLIVMSAMIAAFFFKISLFLLVIGLISIFVFQSNSSADDRSDTVVVQIVTGQCLVVGLSMPAIVAIYNCLSVFYNKICHGVFICPVWFNDFMQFLMFFLIPFVFLISLR